MSASNSGLPDLDITDTLTSPGGTFELASHANSFGTKGYTQNEARLLENQLNDLILGMGGSVHSKLLKQREDTLAKVAAYAKAELDGNTFGGINAGDNQIGFSILRPGHIRADPANGDTVNDWFFDPGATGTVDWIGNGGANNFTVSEDQVSVAFAFTDQSNGQSPISTLDIETFGRNMDLLPTDTNDARIRDNDTEQQSVAIPTIVASERDDVYCKLRFDRNVERQPRFFGVTFGLGSFLNATEY